MLNGDAAALTTLPLDVAVVSSVSGAVNCDVAAVVLILLLFLLAHCLYWGVKIYTLGEERIKVSILRC